MYHAIYYVKIQPYYVSFCFLGNAIIKKILSFFQEKKNQGRYDTALGDATFHPSFVAHLFSKPPQFAFSQSVQPEWS